MAFGARGAAAQPSPSPTATPRSPTFKVMTWNIQGKYVETPFVGGTNPIVNVIKRYDPDIIGLQEIWEPQAHKIAFDLGWVRTWRHVYWTVANNQTLEGTAILSRYPLSNKVSWRLHDVTGDHARYLMRATTKVRGRTLHLYNTHLTNRSESGRQTQAQELIEHIEDDRRAARGSFRPVLTGDMNATSKEPAYSILSSNCSGPFSRRVVLGLTMGWLLV